MGEARRRGIPEDRRNEAIRRNKAMLVEHLGGRDAVLDARLRAGFSPFISRLGTEQWKRRRAAIIAALQNIDEGAEMENARPIRVKDDEIGWYLYLAEQALNDPLCNDIAQAQRTLPYFSGIGSRWSHVHRVRGIDQKLDEILHTYKAAPDGGIFELSVALAYASKGWDVEFVPTQRGAGVKTPDMIVRKDGLEINVECKRQDRRAAYAEAERKEFLRLWDAAVPVLEANRQWIWMKGVFHVELSTISTEFLGDKLSGRLPLRSRESMLYDGPELTLMARRIDELEVRQHFQDFRVKATSPMLFNVVGGDWVPKNSAVTMAKVARVSQLAGCDIPVLGRYIDEIAWACGFTRGIDAEISVDKKARDIKKLLAEAVKQVPAEGLSIIHIAAETLEGSNVERRRTAKVMESVPNFVTDKPVLAVRFHRFKPNHSADQLFEFDETVDTFQRAGGSLDEIPMSVVVPDDVEMQSGSHWDLYPNE